MAHLYKRGRQFWISYYVSGELVQKSLRTTNERIAAAKRKRLECDLALGDLHVASKTPLVAILEAFCKELEATRTFKSYKRAHPVFAYFSWSSSDQFVAGFVQGVDLEFEEIDVPKAVGLALQDADLGVGSFQRSGGDAIGDSS